MSLSYDEFKKVDIRIGTIVAVEDFTDAIKPGYKLVIDFGPELGLKTASARLTEHYTKDMLMNMQVVAVVNFPPLEIGNFVCDVSVLGLPDEAHHTVLVLPTKPVPNGRRMY